METAPSANLAQTPDTQRVLTDIHCDRSDPEALLRSYEFSHQLANHSLLSLESVRQVAQDMLEQGRDKQVFFATDMVGEQASLDNGGRPEQLLETFDSLESARAWVRLLQVDSVLPEVNDFVESFYDELSELYQFDLRKRVFKPYVTLFISSPGTTTPYHMDHTWNFLFQISGEKTVFLYDPNNDDVVSSADKERYYASGSSLPDRREQVAPEAAYKLTPGKGAHHPVNAPHAVENGSQISVSLSVGFCLYESTRHAHIYQVNYLLRRLGMSPSDPGQSKLRDQLKAGLIQSLTDRNTDDLQRLLNSGWERFYRLSGASLLSKLRNR